MNRLKYTLQMALVIICPICLWFGVLVIIAYACSYNNLKEKEIIYDSHITEWVEYRKYDNKIMNMLYLLDEVFNTTKSEDMSYYMNTYVEHVHTTTTHYTGTYYGLSLEDHINDDLWWVDSVFRDLDDLIDELPYYVEKYRNCTPLKYREYVETWNTSKKTFISEYKKLDNTEKLNRLDRILHDKVVTRYGNEFYALNHVHFSCDTDRDTTTGKIDYSEVYELYFYIENLKDLIEDKYKIVKSYDFTRSDRIKQARYNNCPLIIRYDKIKKELENRIHYDIPAHLYNKFIIYDDLTSFTGTMCPKTTSYNSTDDYNFNKAANKDTIFVDSYVSGARMVGGHIRSKPNDSVMDNRSYRRRVRR